VCVCVCVCVCGRERESGRENGIRGLMRCGPWAFDEERSPEFSSSYSG
jgi:hypothetical protein